MDRLKQIESHYNASLEVSEEDFEWLVNKLAGFKLSNQSLSNSLDKEIKENEKLKEQYIKNLDALGSEFIIMDKFEELKKDIKHLKAVNKQLKDMYEAKCEEIEALQLEIIKAFENWALGNFDDERFHIEIQLLVYKLEQK